MIYVAEITRQYFLSYHKDCTTLKKKHILCHYNATMYPDCRLYFLYIALPLYCNPVGDLALPQHFLGVTQYRLWTSTAVYLE